MPKTKTHKGLKKRVKVTAKKRVVRSRAFTGHLLSGRPSKRLRKLHKKAVVFKGETPRILRALGE